MSIHKLFNLWRSHHPTHVNMVIWGWGWGEGVKVGENEVELWDILKLWQKEKKFWWRQIEYFFLEKNKQTNKKPESDLHFPGRLTDRYNTQRHTVTNTQKGRGEGAIITCHPSWHHVHLGGVWLQHAIQLLLSCWIGRKVDRPSAQKKWKHSLKSHMILKHWEETLLFFTIGFQIYRTWVYAVLRNVNM